MKILSKAELDLLIHETGSPAVSLYLPTHRKGNIEQDPIRLKNLLRDTENQLSNYELRPPTARKFLNPLVELLSDSLFWQNQGDGLAIFLSAKVFRHYQVPCRFPELSVVSDSFHIKPLIPLLSEDGIFYILTLSQNNVKLLQCTRYFVRDITPENIPSSFEETLQYDQQEKQLQFRTQQTDGHALFHGHGVKKDFDKVNILRYFHEIDQGVKEILKGEHAPLIVAAVEYLHPLYREASSYPNLSDEKIAGNPDEVSEKSLQEKGWELVQPYFERERKAALKKYPEALSKGRATNDLKEAVLAAHDGRIATIFVEAEVQQWGYFDSENRKVHLVEEKRAGLKDLLDVVASATLMKDGAVYVLKSEHMPDSSAVAALLRY